MYVVISHALNPKMKLLAPSEKPNNSDFYLRRRWNRSFYVPLINWTFSLLGVVVTGA